jgi:hypothetical protein
VDRKEEWARQEEEKIANAPDKKYVSCLLASNQVSIIIIL